MDTPLEIKKSNGITQISKLESFIVVIRGQYVMLDFQLAELYGVENRALKQAVMRNIDRFPDDFMFRLTREESKSLLLNGESQNVIPKGYNFGGSTPYAFTEQGVAMLSSVLRSKNAIRMNIDIMRAFVAARKLFMQNKEHEMAISELRARMKMLEDALSSNIGTMDNLSVEMKEELKKIYKVLGVLSQRYIEQKERKPVGYEAIDAERKAKDDQLNDNNK